MAEATITVTLRRDDGVVISREVNVRTSVYVKSQTKFKADARRRAISAINAVFGVPKDVTVEGAD